MNLKPVDKHDPVTILMVPFDRYSTFLRSVDTVLATTTVPFKLLIVEGAAPDDVRRGLEERKKKHRHIQIIYSEHPLRMAEAFNLGLVHIRTPYAFLMHNRLSTTPGWLQNLLEYRQAHQGLLVPQVNNADAMPYSFLHSFLVKKDLLDQMGLFDTSVGTPFWGVDLANRLQKKNIPIHRDAHSTLIYQAPPAPKGADRKLFLYQWDDPHAHQTLAYLKQKWGHAPEEDEYLQWLTTKRSLARHKKRFAMPLLPLFSLALHFLHKR